LNISISGRGNAKTFRPDRRQNGAGTRRKTPRSCIFEGASPRAAGTDDRAGAANPMILKESGEAAGETVLTKK